MIQRIVSLSRALLVLLVFVFSNGITWSYTPIINLTDSTTSVLLNHTTVWVSEQAEADVLPPDTSFRPLKTLYLTTYDASTWYWTKTIIINKSGIDKEWFFMNHNYTLRNLDVFIDYKNKTIQNIHYEYPKTTIGQADVKHSSPTYHLILPKNDTVLLYTRVQHNKVSQFGFELVEHRYFFNTSILNYMWIGLLYGGLILIALYHLIFYYQLKQSFYIWYGVFVLFQTIYLSFRDGTSLSLLFAHQPWAFEALYRWIVAGLSISVFLYGQHFLGLQKKKWIQRSLILYCFVRVVLNFGMEEYTIGFMWFDFMTILVLLFLTFYYYPTRNKESRYFILSIIIISIGYGINLLWHSNIITNTPFVYNSLYFTILIEAILFSIANSYRFRNLQLQEDEKIRLASVVELKSDLIHKQNQIIQERTEELETFLYKASHDLRGPLKSIDGLCELGKKDTGDAITYYTMILKSSQRLQSILSSLLEIAKRRGSTLQVSPFSLHQLIEDCVQQDLRAFPGINEIKVSYHIPKDVLLQTEYYSFYSVVQNIIENAIKYKDNDKPIQTLTIDYSMTSFGHKISFTDNGIGIPKKSLDKIFQMFYRAHSQQPTGVGLGLYMVKQTLLHLQGKIEVYSEEKKYTRVEIELPFQPNVPSL